MPKKLNRSKKRIIRHKKQQNNLLEKRIKCRVCGNWCFPTSVEHNFSSIHKTFTCEECENVVRGQRCFFSVYGDQVLKDAKENGIKIILL